MRFAWALLPALTALAQLPPGCAAFPDCLYSPGPAVNFGTTPASLSYRDAANDLRTIELFVRTPVGTGALPVVVWSAGADVTGEARSIMTVWSEATARAGYLTVTLAQPLRDEAQAERYCNAVKVNTPACVAIGYTNLDRVADLREVLNWLERANAQNDSPLRGRVDLRRIALAGHADGGNAALSLAGARRLLTTTDRGKPNDFSDARPAVFISLSPQGPNGHGFYDTTTFDDSDSWRGITRPVLLATAASDNDCASASTCVTGDSAARRKIAFDLMGGSAKHFVMVNGVKVSHEFIGSLDPQACAAATCGEFANWYRSSVLAFLDGYLKENRAALGWLRAGLLKEASKGGAEALSGPAPAPPAPPTSCPGFPNCLYPVGTTYAYQRQTFEVTYTDVTGRPRTVEVTARIPTRPGALPVVIWAHGGGDGRNFAGGSVGALSAWAETSAEVGYLSIAPAFHVREGEDHTALCQHLGITEPERCATLSTLTWDRPFDIRAVIDELERLNRAGPFRGRIDLDRLAVGGHSAGSGGTLAVAGASREVNGKRYGAADFSDPRPKAFVALSPSTPGQSWFFDRRLNDDATSWDGIQRPVLVATGSGDAHEQFPQGRRIGYEFMPPGDKYRFWVNDVAFSHSAFGDEYDTCGEAGQVPPRKCGPFRNLLSSVVRAFLDAYLERKSDAMTYLQNGYAAGVARDLVEWSKK